jgi:hypothetical protein
MWNGWCRPAAGQSQPPDSGPQSRGGLRHRSPRQPPPHSLPRPAAGRRPAERRGEGKELPPRPRPVQGLSRLPGGGPQGADNGVEADELPARPRPATRLGLMSDDVRPLPWAAPVYIDGAMAGDAAPSVAERLPLRRGLLDRTTTLPTPTHPPHPLLTPRRRIHVDAFTNPGPSRLGGQAQPDHGILQPHLIP